MTPSLVLALWTAVAIPCSSPPAAPRAEVPLAEVQGPVLQFPVLAMEGFDYYLRGGDWASHVDVDFYCYDRNRRRPHYIVSKSLRIRDVIDPSTRRVGRGAVLTTRQLASTNPPVVNVYRVVFQPRALNRPLAEAAVLNEHTESDAGPFYWVEVEGELTGKRILINRVSSQRPRKLRPLAPRPPRRELEELREDLRRIEAERQWQARARQEREAQPDRRGRKSLRGEAARAGETPRSADRLRELSQDVRDLRREVERTRREVHRLSGRLRAADKHRGGGPGVLQVEFTQFEYVNNTNRPVAEVWVRLEGAGGTILEDETFAVSGSVTHIPFSPPPIDVRSVTFQPYEYRGETRVAVGDPSPCTKPSTHNIKSATCYTHVGGTDGENEVTLNTANPPD